MPTPLHSQKHWPLLFKDNAFILTMEKTRNKGYNKTNSINPKPLIKQNSLTILPFVEIFTSFSFLFLLLIFETIWVGLMFQFLCLVVLCSVHCRFGLRILRRANWSVQCSVPFFLQVFLFLEGFFFFF